MSLRLILCLAMLAVLGACSKPAPPEEPVRAVKLMTVQSAALSATQEFSGDVRARIESRLGFRVAGKIIARHVEVGQSVKAGQLLAEVDPQDYRLAQEAARAQVQAALTQRDLAAADFKRYQALVQQGFISGAELERRDTTLKAAQALLDQAQAQAANQGNQAAYTRLLADRAGVVTAVEAEPGQVVAAGAPVVRVAQEGPRDVVFALPEDKLGRVSLGQTLQVQLWGQDAQLAAKVREIAASADPVTRTFAIKLALPANAAAALGVTATVRLSRDSAPRQEVIKLPTTALRQEQGKTSVWVYDPAQQTVNAQEVEVSTADANEAVIAKGLSLGQQVVVAGVHVLSPGQKVTVYRSPYEKPANGAAK